MPVVANELWRRFLVEGSDADLTGAVGVLTGLVCRLFTNDFHLVPDTTADQLVEADYTGYTNRPLTWSGPFIRPGGGRELIGGQLLFSSTGSATPNRVYGWYATDTGGAFLFGDRLAQPFDFTRAGDALVLTPRFNLPPSV